MACGPGRGLSVTRPDRRHPIRLETFIPQLDHRNKRRLLAGQRTTLKSAPAFQLGSLSDRLGSERPVGKTNVPKTTLSGQ